MKTYKRFISFCLAFLLVISVFPLQGKAADFSCSSYDSCIDNGGEIYEVIKEGAPIRRKPNKEGEVVARCHKGQLISVKRVFYTRKLQKWCELNVKDNGNKLYVFTGNVKPHMHAFINLYETSKGAVLYCPKCGYVEANANGQATCDMRCIADQAFRGVYSEYDPSFASVVAQIVVGEIPYVGTAADIRDTIGDIQHGAPISTIVLDGIALVPLVGVLKYSKHMDELKYMDDISEVIQSGKRIPWMTWNEYDKVVENGQEFAKIGKYKYTKHSVEEFYNPSYETNWQKRVNKNGKVSYEEHSRGIPPAYVDWALTDGLQDGSTVLLNSRIDDNRDVVKTYLNGSLKITIKNDDTVITICDTGKSKRK